MTTPKVRVHEVSKVLGVPNAEVIGALAKHFNVQVKSHSSTIDQDIADKVIAHFKANAAAKSSSASAAKEKEEKTATKTPQASKAEEKPAASVKTPEKPAPSAPAKVVSPSVTPAKPAASTTAQTSPQPSKPSTSVGVAPQPKPQATTPQTTTRPQPAAQTRPATPPAAGRPVPQQGQRPGGHPSQKSRPQDRRQRREETQQEATPVVVRIDEPLTVRDLAAKLRLRETEIIKHLFMKGMMVTVNQTLDVDFAKSLAKELGAEVEEVKKVQHEGEYTHLDTEGVKKLDEGKFKNLQPRPPVVSIMGHVDHGKTTLLDSIRESRYNVVDTEAGGITQRIGAYTVTKNDQTIVFLDTPGHEAFTAMRMRGAKSTDIAILVVAADDGVMPQTIEAINHAKAAKIPIIVAVNKIDKPDADPDRVLVQLADYGLSAEKWGGDTLTVEVSALQKLGLDDLLDSILLVADLLELKADPTVPAEGVIIEAQLDKRMGPIATALVQNGTLKVGDNVLIGSVGGRIRALINDHGERVQSAGPASPVGILGLDGVPNAGDSFRVIRNDKEFKQALAAGKQQERDQRLGVSRAVAAGFSGRSETDESAVKENQFNLLVKADTQGSLEAVVDVLQRMTNEEVKINIVHSATGDVSEADVMLAATAKALIIAFNSKADANAQRLSENQGVVIKRYDVIYHITEEIEKWVLGQLEPETEEVQAGTAEVRQIFKVGKTGVIAGCMVTSGKVLRNAKVVVLRNGKQVFTGTLDNLKRFKDDVKEVASGYECGISFDRYNDLQEGDIIEVYTVKSLERTSL